MCSMMTGRAMDMLLWYVRTWTTYAVDCSLLAAAPVAGIIPAKDGGA